MWGRPMVYVASPWHSVHALSRLPGHRREMENSKIEVQNSVSKIETCEAVANNYKTQLEALSKGSATDGGNAKAQIAMLEASLANAASKEKIGEAHRKNIEGAVDSFKGELEKQLKNVEEDQLRLTQELQARGCF